MHIETLSELVARNCTINAERRKLKAEFDELKQVWAAGHADAQWRAEHPGVMPCTGDLVACPFDGSWCLLHSRQAHADGSWTAMWAFQW